MKKLILITLLFTLYFSLSYAQIINTIAGNRVAGYTGNGGQATAAELSDPAGIVLDNSGNIYFADYNNNVIRKVTKSTGIITTIAGNGYGALQDTGNYSGDGGQATSAELYLPTDIALDSSGNIYIADYDNNRIRMVRDSTGIITTIAGNGMGAFSGDNGPATAAELNQPVFLIFDDSGNIYFSDAENFRIRKISAITRIITTIAGNGSGPFSGDGGPATDAELAYPSGLALDDSNNLYIADYFNNRIRKVSKSSGLITSFAGNGYGAPSYGGYGGDGGPAIDAELYNPTDVKLDALGNLYIADADNNRIRKVNPLTGIITTIAGNGSPGFSGNGGQATNAELNGPVGIAIDAFENIYISDANNHVLRKIDIAAGIGQLNNANNIYAYPNPSNGVFTIQSTGIKGNLLLEVYTIFDEKLFTFPFQSQNSSFSSIDMSNYASGIYLYRILKENGELIGNGKLIIQK